MIVFIYGTTAEAIKIAPVARRLEAAGVPYQHWITQQHTDALRKAIPELGLTPPDRVIANGWRGKPLKSPLQMVGWAFDVVVWAARNMRSLRRELPQGSVVVVHGDTMTTVLGTFIGRRLRVPVAHVEAGLRSGNWRHPFPEELDRRIVGRFADIHYVPSQEAADNLAGRPNVVVTQGNTAKDAVRDAAAAVDELPADDPFGLVLLHRYEFISNPALVRETLQTLDAGTPIPLRLIVDQYSRGAIEQTIDELGLTNFSIMTKLEHGQFVALMKSARFIVTDSGGIQQESAALGVPTLIHRVVTEGREGFGASAVLSGWDQDVVREFLTSYETYRRNDVDAGDSPSDIIVADLFERGLAVPVAGGAVPEGAE
ncbi:UDP-N-acetylglucosamine 2-epimerase [Microbacterium trichothecenolyticum]|uniref:UDP-N-acetylglucosamine 2-epimerase n=1 Tax=Microbacterium trichothecenolyticum TaxID=69370 RepID=A0A0M2H4J9_MICTR|nr:UDP-N-acetylglucosamine 2-epimerase [Microbacterium trichothecenolyticum]KJL41233.1 UDP-N-acetylglucosamine 2-epimerase [Microbacterium trichothecenolyticum]